METETRMVEAEQMATKAPKTQKGPKAPKSGKEGKTKSSKPSKEFKTKAPKVGDLKVKSEVGKSTAVRHKNLQKKNPLQGISNPGLRRIASRAGCIRAGKSVYMEARSVLNDFVNSIIKDAVLYSESAKRKTVVISDVTNSLKRNNNSLFGYN